MSLATWWAAQKARHQKDRDNYAAWCEMERQFSHYLVVSIHGELESIYVEDIRCTAFPRYGKAPLVSGSWMSSFDVAISKAQYIARTGIYMTTDTTTRVYPAHQIRLVEIKLTPRG